jgi:acetyltransferase-like isoleucine patch superfamily enzyme
VNPLTRAWRRLRQKIEYRLLDPAEYYRRRGAKIGRVGAFMRPRLAEPHLCEIGNNVWIAADVTFLNHDGSVVMLHGLNRTDAVNVVGKIVIHDNVFIGRSTILMADVQVGPNAIVAAGSVVTRDVPPETVVGGVPAKPLCTLDEYVARYAGEDVTLWAERESEIRTTVIRHFMEEGHRGKWAIRLREGKTKHTAVSLATKE